MDFLTSGIELQFIDIIFQKAIDLIYKTITLKNVILDKNFAILLSD